MQNWKSRLKRGTGAVLAAVLIAGSTLGSLGATVSAASADHVVISQVYGGGGNSGATYSHDFIELYNPTEQPVSLADWKVRYASAAGEFSNTNNVTTLTGTIAPGGYYLIGQASTAAVGEGLPPTDATGGISMGASNGKVDLVDASNARIDLVGYGTASGVEGTATPALSSTTAAIRKTADGAVSGSRGEDTDNNAQDFNVVLPDPRNSAYNPLAASAVTASPAPNAWPAGTEITLSTTTEDATIQAAVYGVSGTEVYEPYAGPFPLTEDITVKAFAEAAGMADSSISTFNYELLEKTNIAAARPHARGQNVWTEGVVTHIAGAEMYIQDETAGIVLYGFPEFANVGDRVEVSGVMDIYSNLEEIKPLTGLDFEVVEHDADMPEPLLLTAADLSAANGEAHEAELVAMEDVTITGVNGSRATASQAGDTFTIYFNSSKLVQGATFEHITGVIKQFNAEYQFIPLSDNALVENLLSVMATPGAGPIIIGGQVELTSPTDGAEIRYTLDGTDPAAASPLYAGPITVNEDVVIKAIAIAGGETSEIYTFPYTASEKPRIHDIQGESHISPFAGQKVTDIEGIVTQYGYTFANGNYKGFFMQDPSPDDNDNTSEGIFVYSTNEWLKPAIGDLVEVTGTVSEYNEGSNGNLTSTQITMEARTIVDHDQELPEPIVLGKDGRAIPSTIVDNDAMEEFQPEEDAIDFYESLEGMLVELPTPTILSPYWTSGSGSAIVYNIPTRVDNGSYDVITPAGGLALKEQGNLNPHRLLIAYGKPGREVNTGDKFASDITGVIGYNNGNFKVIPAWNSLPEITPGTFRQETTTIEAHEDKLLIAAYNIENYYPGVGAAKTDKLAESIVTNMKQPDIIGVVEMQDGNGQVDDATVEADASALIAAIVEKGGPRYVYTDIAPQDKQDGGAPGGNIRVGFLYNEERVTLVEGTKGGSNQAVSYDAAADELSHNPGRIDPTNAAFHESRKPLAAQFEFKGEKFIVIANHFNSKSGDNGPFGAAQPPVLSSEAQRHDIAAVVNGFVKDVLTKNPDANIVALGDLNDFQFTRTAEILKGDELDNLIDKLPAREQYTYTFDGNSQVLDYILVSKNLTSRSVVDIVHLNADFSPSAGRVSDHDPVLAQIDLREGFPLTVLHTNDTHANLDTTSSPNNILRRLTAIRETKASSVNDLLVDAGDVFSGSLYFNQYKGLADLEFMNLAGYDAMTFGNHEFDIDSRALSQFVGNAEFPFVSSNVNFSQDDILSQMFRDEIGSPALEKNIYPAIIMEIDGEQVGLIGLTTEDTENIASPGDVTFEDVVVKAAAAVEMLENEGVNKIIVLSHLGYDADLALAEAVAGIDIIVGGHTHTKLEEPYVDETDPDAPKLIVQAGEKGLFLGRLEVLFNDEGVLTEWNEKLISIDEKKDNVYVIGEDAQAKSILETKYKPGVLELSATEVGHTEVVLNGLRADVRSKETNLGNLIADGMLAAAKALRPNAVIALQNGGGIRETINEGPITLGEVLTVLPFNNDLVTITLTGQEIKEAMENGVSTITETSPDGRFPHIAGMRFDYDSTKPVGERVVRMQVKEGARYVTLDLEKSYEVATNAFTAKGGDFYASLENAYNEGRVNLLYLPDYEVFSGYIEQIGTITAATSAVEGRIVDLKGNPLPTPTPPASTPDPWTPTTPTPSPTTSPSPTPTTMPSPTPTPTPVVSFDDVEDHWAADSIGEAVEAGIVKGYDDGTFRPDDETTRAEFVTMIGRALDLGAPSGDVPAFKDTAQVPIWARDFFARLIEDKVITGYEDGTLRPANPLTRTVMTVILVRALGIEIEPGATASFADAGDIQPWARPYIAAAHEAGLVDGVGGNRFAPESKATRAEVVTLLLSVLEYLEKAEQ